MEWIEKGIGGLGRTIDDQIKRKVGRWVDRGIDRYQY